MPAGRGGVQSSRRLRCRGRAADARADRRDRRGDHQAEALRLPLHQRAPLQEGDEGDQALPLLLVRGAPGRAPRDPRHRRRAQGRVRRCDQGDQGGAGGRLPRLHQHHAVQRQPPGGVPRAVRHAQRPRRRGDDGVAGLPVQGGRPPRYLHAARGGSGLLPPHLRGLQGQRSLLQQPALPGLPPGQARLRVQPVDDADLHAGGLAQALLPHRRWARPDLRGADDHREVGRLRAGQGPALRYLHDALRL